MNFIKHGDKYQVKVSRNGDKNKFGDYIFEYKVVSKEPIEKVKEYCMTVIHKSYYEDNLPNPFATKLVEFGKIDEVSDEIGSIYFYSVNKQGTS